MSNSNYSGQHLTYWLNMNDYRTRQLMRQFYEFSRGPNIWYTLRCTAWPSTRVWVSNRTKVKHKTSPTIVWRPNSNNSAPDCGIFTHDSHNFNRGWGGESSSIFEPSRFVALWLRNEATKQVASADNCFPDFVQVAPQFRTRRTNSVPWKRAWRIFKIINNSAVCWYLILWCTAVPVLSPHILMSAYVPWMGLTDRFRMI